MKGKCFLFTFALLLAGCTASYDHKGKTPVVQVGKDFLYREDLEAVMSVNLGKEDSARFAEEYIKNWLEDALLYDKAEGNISDNEDRGFQIITVLLSTITAICSIMWAIR